jgi:hypothetical protein
MSCALFAVGVDEEEEKGQMTIVRCKKLKGNKQFSLMLTTLPPSLLTQE